MKARGPTIRVSRLERCARCGRTHKDVDFVPLRRPVGRLTHWAVCPRVLEPILLLVKDGPPRSSRAAGNKEGKR